MSEHTKAADESTAPVPAGGTPGGLAREKVNEQQDAVNPTEPRTKKDYIEAAYQRIQDARHMGMGETAIRVELSTMWELGEAEAIQDVRNADRPATEPPTNVAGGPLLEPHDGGCRCWPHVAQGDALRAVEHAALMEYRSPRAEAAQGSHGAALDPVWDDIYGDDGTAQGAAPRGDGRGDKGAGPHGRFTGTAADDRVGAAPLDANLDQTGRCIWCHERPPHRDGCPVLQPKYSEGAVPRAEGLDHCHRCGACVCEQHTAYSDDTWDEQRRICAKCLASRPSDERVPESEEPR